jgi:hypothetical protein
MARAGRSATKNCPATVRFGTPPESPNSARPSPASAWRPDVASCCAHDGSGTLRSLSARGGMSAGLNFASTMT